MLATILVLTDSVSKKIINHAFPRRLCPPDVPFPVGPKASFLDFIGSPARSRKKTEVRVWEAPPPNGFGVRVDWV